MSTMMLKVTGDDFFVGDRVFVEIQLFNPRTKQPASALAPELKLIHEDGLEIDGGNMVEIEAGSGLYGGSEVVTLEGRWKVEVAVGAPFESRWQYDRLLVNP